MPPMGQSGAPRSVTRGKAVGGFASMIILLPLNVLWHGLPVLWQDYPQLVRRCWKQLVTGKTGPYPGVVW